MPATALEKGRKKTNLTTRCYIEQDGKYLMMHRGKKAHDINHDKWIGVGGHFEPDETPEECLLREVREETGLVLDSFRLRGIITFMSDKWQPEYIFLYTADAFHGPRVRRDDCNADCHEHGRSLRAAAHEILRQPEYNGEYAPENVAGRSHHLALAYPV